MFCPKFHLVRVLNLCLRHLLQEDSLACFHPCPNQNQVNWHEACVSRIHVLSHLPKPFARVLLALQMSSISFEHLICMNTLHLSLLELFVQLVAQEAIAKVVRFTGIGCRRFCPRTCQG